VRGDQQPQSTVSGLIEVIPVPGPVISVVAATERRAGLASMKPMPLLVAILWTSPLIRSLFRKDLATSADPIRELQ
jgi:hypothetical protein